MSIKVGQLEFIKYYDEYHSNGFVNEYAYKIQKQIRHGHIWWIAEYKWKRWSDQNRSTEFNHAFLTRKDAMQACASHNKNPRTKYTFRGRDKNNNLTFKSTDHSLVTWIVDPRWLTVSITGCSPDGRFVR